MEINTEYKSPLVLKNLLISECSFKRSEESLQNLKLKLGIKHTIELPLNESAKTYKVSLEVSLKDDAEKLKLNVNCVAHFETTQGDTSLIEKNAIAIMFPYVRSYISSITAQPGMSPIVLPPINVVAMLQEK